MEAALYLQNRAQVLASHCAPPAPQRHGSQSQGGAPSWARQGVDVDIEVSMDIEIDTHIGIDFS